MKKLLNISFIYAMAAIVCGVFYREFTKFMQFTGRTTLGFTHVHLFMLGMMVFLVLALFAQRGNLMEQRGFKRFLVAYNVGLPIMVVMLIVRGIVQVMGTQLSSGMDAMISGIAGIGHIIITVALVMLFNALKRTEFGAGN